MDEDIRRGLSQVLWNPDENRLRTPFRLGTTLALLLIVVVLVAVLGAVIGGALDLGARVGAAGNLLLVAVLSVALLGITYVVDRRYLGDLGLAADGPWARDVVFGFAAGFLMGAIAVGAAVLAGVATVEGTVVSGDSALAAGPFPVAVALSFVSLLVLAFFEELVFRGYILVNVAEGLRGLTDSRRATLIALTASAVFFGFAHAANPAASAVSAANITLFGLLLGGGYVLTDRLAIPVGIHTAWNFTLGPVFGTPVSGLSTGVAVVDVDLDGAGYLTGGAFGLEAGLLALVALAAGAGALLAWLRLTTGEVSIHEQVVQPDLWTRE